MMPALVKSIYIEFIAEAQLIYISPKKLDTKDLQNELMRNRVLWFSSFGWRFSPAKHGK